MNKKRHFLKHCLAFFLSQEHLEELRVECDAAEASVVVVAAASELRAAREERDALAEAGGVQKESVWVGIHLRMLKSSTATNFK